MIRRLELTDNKHSEKPHKSIMPGTKIIFGKKTNRVL